MANSKAGTFNAYLEYAQRNSSESGQRTSAPASLLSVLAQLPEDGTSMSKLADLSGMSAAGFRDTLKNLASAGFITISGEPLAEVVKITPKGQDAVSIL
jgi:predicted transcriptional regulator